MYAIIGTTPFSDRAVCVGPFRSYAVAREAGTDLEFRGYMTEVVELVMPSKIDSIGFVTNDED